jgi:ankyrin repeat protein
MDHEFDVSVRLLRMSLEHSPIKMNSVTHHGTRTRGTRVARGSILKEEGPDSNTHLISSLQQWEVEEISTQHGVPDEERWHLHVALLLLAHGANAPWPAVLVRLVHSGGGEHPWLPRAFGSLLALHLEHGDVGGLGLFDLGRHVLAWDGELGRWVDAHVLQTGEHGLCDVIVGNGNGGAGAPGTTQNARSSEAGSRLSQVMALSRGSFSGGYSAYQPSVHQRAGSFNARQMIGVMCIAPTPNGAGALLIASAGQGYELLVKELLALGVSVFTCDYKCKTPLHYAAAADRAGVCSLLLDAGADPQLRDVHSRSAIDLALDAKLSGIVDLLQPSDVSHDMADPVTEPLVELVRLCSLEQHAAVGGGGGFLGRSLRGVKDKAKERAIKSMNTPAENGVTLLMAACHVGDMNFLELALQHNADVNHRSQRGVTPLSVATQQGHTEVVHALLSVPGIELGAGSVSELTIASKLGSNAILVQLLGGTLSATAHRGPPKVWDGPRLREALLHAAENGHIACVASLLTVGHAPVDGAGEDGTTPLMKCGRHGHPVCASDLLKAGADLSIVDSMGRNAVMHACMAGHAGVALTLISAINQIGNSKLTKRKTAGGGGRISSFDFTEESSVIQVSDREAVGSHCGSSCEVLRAASSSCK